MGAGRLVRDAAITAAGEAEADRILAETAADEAETAADSASEDAGIASTARADAELAAALAGSIAIGTSLAGTQIIGRQVVPATQPAISKFAKPSARSCERGRIFISAGLARRTLRRAA